MSEMQECVVERSKNAKKVKQPHEFVNEPMAKAYMLGDVHWIDTPTDSWRLVCGLGYVRDNGGE